MVAGHDIVPQGLTGCACAALQGFGEKYFLVAACMATKTICNDLHLCTVADSCCHQKLGSCSTGSIAKHALCTQAWQNIKNTAASQVLSIKLQADPMGPANILMKCGKCSGWQLHLTVKHGKLTALLPCPVTV